MREGSDVVSLERRERSVEREMERSVMQVETTGRGTVSELYGFSANLSFEPLKMCTGRGYILEKVGHLTENIIL